MTDQPRTLAEASRQRRDLVTGAVMAEHRLIRFVASPDGGVLPDLGRKLPGRGLWVAADRASVETAVKKNLFSRAAKTRLAAPADLADRVAGGLKGRLLSGLGLARRAGDLIFGFEKVAASLAAGRAAWLIEAADGAPDGRRKILSALRKAPNAPALCGLFDSAQLGLALAGENVIHLALLSGRPAVAWTREAERLAGFCPLVPEAWRDQA